MTKRGRPTKYATDEERQAAGRERYKRYNAKRPARPPRAQHGTQASGGKYTAVRDREQAFIGIDGESLDTEGADRYVLLAASDGSEVCNPDGLSTQECIGYLLGLARRTGWRSRVRKTWFVWFGSNYDVNQILADVPRALLETLWADGTVYWSPEWLPLSDSLTLTWHKGKRFSVSHYRTHKSKKGEWKRVKLAGFSSYDVFGFCQTSFMEALRGWKVLDADSPEFRFMEQLKGQRGAFSKLDMETVRHYNRCEVDALAALAKAIYTAHEVLGLTLESMHGAGATAHGLLDSLRIVEALPENRGEGIIHPYHRYPHQAIGPAVLSAYYGGWIQLQRLGWHETVFNYDLRSAYPWAASTLPDLHGARWSHCSDYDPDALAIWRVRWNIPSTPAAARRRGSTIYPFPLRHKSHIYYVGQGEGWYWSPLVTAALRHFPGQLQILEGWALKGGDQQCRPFAVFADLFEQRKQYKAEGHLAERVIKLGMNATYGMLAESPRLRGGKAYTSRHQSYVYAGLITALTRARMLDAVMLNPAAVIAIATDGIFSREALPLQTGEALGEWEAGPVGTDGLFLQPGVYSIQHADHLYGHERGYGRSEWDWQAVRRRCERNIPHSMQTRSRRYCTIGAALARWDDDAWPGQWRHWIDQPRTLHTQFVDYAAVPGEKAKARQWLMTYTLMTDDAYPFSEEYKLRGDWSDFLEDRLWDETLLTDPDL